MVAANTPIKVAVLVTDREIDCGDEPFYETGNFPLGEWIKERLKEVFNGSTCPYFTHFSADGNCGHIIVCSEELSDQEVVQILNIWSNYNETDKVFEMYL